MSAKEPFHLDIAALHPEVTGSCNFQIVKFPNGATTRFVTDCGLFQEKDYSEKNKDFPFEANEISFALITHNHVDHIGRLPLMVKQGFTGNIYATDVTARLMELALPDSRRVLSDIARRNHESELYSDEDVGNTYKLVKKCTFQKTVNVDEHIKATFFINGHLLGAAIILVQISYPGYEDINLLFTGDYSGKNMFFDVPDLPDWVLELPLTVIQEATYGDVKKNQASCFEDNIVRCMDRKGTALIPVFSLGRAQEILYILKMMQTRGILRSEVPIYFDGNLAHRYTDIYLKEEVGIKEEMKEFLPKHLIKVDCSNRQAVLDSNKTKIIVTTSGMGTYGPAQMYIPRYISRPGVLIHFTGYTAEGTLGDRLKNTQMGEAVEISSVFCKKNAEIEYTTEFSAHAKSDQMIEFLRKFKKLKLVLINHGSKEAKRKFSQRIVKEISPKCVAVLGEDHFFRLNPYGLSRALSTTFD